MGDIKIKPFYFFSIFLFLFCRQNILFAEIYKYIDDNNIVIYTDDISQVPESQRKSAFQFKGTSSIYTSDIVKPETIPLSQDDSIRQATSKDPEQRRADFEKEKLKLAEELIKLTQEKKILLGEKLKYKTKKQKTELDEKILIFDKLIHAFNENQNQLNKRIDAFNKELETEGMIKDKN